MIWQVFKGREYFRSVSVPFEILNLIEFDLCWIFPLNSFQAKMRSILVSEITELEGLWDLLLTCTFSSYWPWWQWRSPLPTAVFSSLTAPIVVALVKTVVWMSVQCDAMKSVSLDAPTETKTLARRSVLPNVTNTVRPLVPSNILITVRKNVVQSCQNHHGVVTEWQDFWFNYHSTTPFTNKIHARNRVHWDKMRDVCEIVVTAMIAVNDVRMSQSLFV